MKEIDLNTNIYDLTEQYPELIDILKGQGFMGVGNPVARKTLGKMTTLPKGCQMQGKDLNEVISVLEKEGFTIKK